MFSLALKIALWIIWILFWFMIGWMLGFALTTIGLRRGARAAWRTDDFVDSDAVPFEAVA